MHSARSPTPNASRLRGATRIGGGASVPCQFAGREPKVGDAALLVKDHVVNPCAAVIDQITRQLDPAPLVARRRPQMFDPLLVIRIDADVGVEVACFCVGCDFFSRCLLVVD